MNETVAGRQVGEGTAERRWVSRKQPWGTKDTTPLCRRPGEGQGLAPVDMLVSGGIGLELRSPARQPGAPGTHRKSSVGQGEDFLPLPLSLHPGGCRAKLP